MTGCETELARVALVLRAHAFFLASEFCIAWLLEVADALVRFRGPREEGRVVECG